MSAGDWAEAFESPAPGTPHNEARDEVWEELLTILVEKHETDDDVSPDLVRRSLAHDADLVDAFDRAWPLIEATDLVGDLWEVPAYLRRCAPWLEPDEVRALQRADARAWTVSDLPLLDAARRRLGDPEASRRRRRRAAALAAERARMDRVVDELLQLDDEDGLMAQLRSGRTSATRSSTGRRCPGRARPARRALRPRRRRRGAGAHRRRVADAAAALPVAEHHHRR